MSSISVTYSSGGQSYSTQFESFNGAELARTYIESTNFQRSASGAQILTGLPGRQKYLWAVSAVVPEAVAKEFDDMFQAWDVDRSQGLAAAVSVNDTTGFKSELLSAIISTPPIYTRLGPHDYVVAFGMQEV